MVISLRWSVLFLALAHVLLSTATSDSRDWDTGFATSTVNAQEDSPCGFGSVESIYGNKTASISIVMYNRGLTCGACYEISCTKSSTCSGNTVKVTATSMCSPSYLDGTKNWCREPLKHLELPVSVFSTISDNLSAVVPIKFRPVTCNREGGMRFRVTRHENVVSVLVYNVAGAGDVSRVRIKGSETKWMEMTNGGDSVWVVEHVPLAGQSLSFQVTDGQGRMVESNNVTPIDWKPDGTYVGGQF